MLFTAQDYATLAAIVFRPDYPGYRPHIVEAPNGDPSARDTEKRYSHVSDKYLNQLPPGWPGESYLDNRLYEAFILACQTAETLKVPAAFWPRLEFGALRVLEYPVGATSAEHTDFDLFTLNLYRNTPNPGLPVGEVHMGELGALIGLGPATPHSVAPLATVQQAIVYFAIPDHYAVLPGDFTVGEWIAERMKRSRYDAAHEEKT